ncbi:MAG: xanthine dehydrogenase family protein subunit M [Desulfobacterota bacterium]|jgi:carbon-monoxide dehydrogenase medium subunit|nr:xanthine dehydrogenase family protein subunit M [Thermodesulfobacteriota bacterium]
MLLPKFDYQAPKSLREACALLDEFGAKARLLAGGTDLLVNLKHKKLAPEQVISLNRIKGLDEAAAKKGKGISIGPLATAAYLAENELAQGPLQVLAEGAGRIGSPLIRNRATIGGNIVTARPASDLAPPLLVLGALLILKGKDGERELPVEKFFKGPGKTSIKPKEILSRIFIPEPDGPGAGAYLKLGSRKALEISLVNVASFIEVGADLSIKQARIALGAVAPVPVRAKTAEKFLKGKKPQGENDPLFREAARAAVQDASPITDHRGSAEYRQALIEILTARTLQSAYSRIMKKV